MAEFIGPKTTDTTPLVQITDASPGDAYIAEVPVHHDTRSESLPPTDTLLVMGGLGMLAVGVFLRRKARDS